MSDIEVLLRCKRFDVVRQRRTNRDGKLIEHETVRHPGAVTIIPLVDDDQVCLIRNFRLSVNTHLLELPAGTLEKGEDPAKAAIRELAEETGYQASKIEPLAQFWMSPGILDERMHLFLATGLSDGPQALEDNEEIDRVVLPWDEAMDLLVRGEIQDAKTLVGLFHWDRARRGK